ncbi:MAG: ABC-type multidrug transport system, ATPase and permease component [Herbinix sp.]|jgi:ABC-type multidrug transport system fused ATPase/permease subunit|nr:ABC-type multidrug transport system, ATPase and permease component [Herbinix sp.]
MNNKKSSLSMVVQVIRYFYAKAFRVKPVYLFIIICQTLLKASLPFINTIFPALIIDQLVGDRNLNRLILYIAIIVGGNGLGNIVLEALKCGIEGVEDDLNRHFDMLLSKRALSLDFEQTEDPEVRDQLEKAEQAMTMHTGGIAGPTHSLVGIVSSIITFAGAGAIIFTSSWWLILFIVISMTISAHLNSKINQIELKYFDWTTKINRRFYYLLGDLPDFRHGKDIRLFGSADMIQEKGETAVAEITGERVKEGREKNRYGQADSVVSTISQGMIYINFGLLAILGRITLGGFTMLVASANVFSDSVRSLIKYSLDIAKKASYMQEYMKFMRSADALIKKTVPIVHNGAYEFEFKNVCFRYPRSDSYVIQDLNLKLSSGEHLSIVGLNGAGKTTFVKLLCRLYDVTEGEILLNGINIKEFDYREYLGLFSVVFQDFKLLAYSIRDNIVFDNRKQKREEEILEFVKLSGVEDKINSLEKGLDTILYKMFDENGIEPSGGEAQKIAIARALAKDAPIVILDEPTAALDPIAEFEIYNSFHRLVGNKSAVYISHRLSSCRFSDVIAVFDENTLKEYGTHDELVHKEGGIYASMFEAQAQYYVEA